MINEDIQSGVLDHADRSSEVRSKSIATGDVILFSWKLNS
jgi:hypothetical protein